MTEYLDREAIGEEPEPPKVDVDLTLARTVCQVHGSPFRAGWPSGWPLFSFEGFRRWTAKPDTVAELGGDLKRAGALLDAKPLCCRLSQAELLDLLYWVNQQTKHTRWPRGRCANCKRNLFGGPFLTRAKSYPHVCLRCVVYSTVRDAS